MNCKIGHQTMLSSLILLITLHGAVSRSILGYFRSSAYLCLVTVNLPASTAIEYKYIRKFNGQVTWESDPNNSITTPSSGSFTQNDTWR